MGRNKIHYKCQEKLKKTKQIKSIKINDKVESSPKILSDSFNNFFVTIAEIIDENIIYIYKCKLQGLPGKFSSQFILFKTNSTNEEKVNSIIKQMKTNKAIGPNSISTKILKMSQHIIAKPPV